MDGRIGWPLIDCKHQAGVKRRRGRHARKLVPFRPPAGSTVCCAGCGRRVLIKLARAPPSSVVPGIRARGPYPPRHLSARVRPISASWTARPAVDTWSGASTTSHPEGPAGRVTSQALRFGHRISRADRTAQAGGGTL
jgi:hypothetical protein